MRPAVALALVLALPLALAPRPARAQSGAPAPSRPDSTPADSVRGRRLAPIVVTAKRDRNPLHKLGYVHDAVQEVLSLMRANHKLRGQLRKEDKAISALELRMASLHARAERTAREIVALDSSTAAIRAQRLRLEAQLDLADRLEERLELAERLAAQRALLFGPGR